jgi:hypothetical protein
MATIHFDQKTRLTPEQYAFGRSSDGATDVNVAIVRQGKNSPARARDLTRAHPGAARNRHCGMFRAKPGIAFAPVPS